MAFWAAPDRGGAGADGRSVTATEGLYNHGSAPSLQIIYQRKLVKGEECAIWYTRTDIGLGLTALRAYEVSHDETFAKCYSSSH